MPGPNDPQSPYGQQDTSLDDLRKIREFFKPGRPIDLGRVYDIKQPEPPAPLPAGPKPPANMQPGGRPSPGLNQPTIGELMGASSGDGFSGLPYQGPGVMASALQGLKAQQPPDPLDSISTEELYKQAFADPRSVAPGASPWAATQLRSRIGDEEYMKDLQQKQQGDIMGAETQLNPQVRAAQEQAANLSPAAITGRSQVESTKIASDARTQLADLLLGRAQIGGDISGVTLPGGGSISMQRDQEVPTQTSQNLDKALNASGGMDLFGTNARNLANARTAWLGDFMARQPVNPTMVDFLKGVIANPAARHVPPPGLSQQDLATLKVIATRLGL